MTLKALIVHLSATCVSLFPLTDAIADQYSNIVGSYKLISDQITNLDNTPFECGKKPDGTVFPCQTVKGKIVIEVLPDKTYLYLEAYTIKGIGTLGSLGNYQIRQGQIIESVYAATGLVCCSALPIKLTLEGNTLTRRTENVNSRHTTVWARAGQDEVKDKYLEREIAKQRKIFADSTQKMNLPDNRK